MRSDGCQRARSDAELAFIVMRALAAARLLWARGGALPVDALPTMVQAAPDEVAVAVAMLCDEGIAEVGVHDGTVRLTERAAWEITAAGCGGGAAPRYLN
jgi:hypothetical protein